MIVQYCILQPLTRTKYSGVLEIYLEVTDTKYYLIHRRITAHSEFAALLDNSHPLSHRENNQHLLPILTPFRVTCVPPIHVTPNIYAATNVYTHRDPLSVSSCGGSGCVVDIFKGQTKNWTALSTAVFDSHLLYALFDGSLGLLHLPAKFQSIWSKPRELLILNYIFSPTTGERAEARVGISLYGAAAALWLPKSGANLAASACLVPFRRNPDRF